LLAVACAAAVLVPSSALAAARVWYVAPNGAETGECTQAEPCTLKDVVEKRILELALGDTVMLAGNAGTYGSAITPLTFSVFIREGVTFTGTPGQPMPKVYSSALPAFEVYGPNSLLSDIDVESSGGSAAVYGEGTINRVIAHAMTGGTGCGLLHTITDSVCTGAFGVAETIGGGGKASTTIRNSTVYGSEYGLHVADSGAVDIELSATNTIFHSEGKGGGTSIFAHAEESPSTIHVVLSHSNYATVHSAGPGSASVAVAEADQTAPPLFVNPGTGDYRAAPGSPTIDAGSDSPLNGPFDLEGYARQIGSHTDIGAYEFLIAATAITTTVGGVGPTTATLNGTVNPNGLASSFHFVYGTTTAYGAATAVASAGAGAAATAVSATVTGLAPNTTYHYQLLASNSVGPGSGGDLTFTTPPATSGSPATVASLGGLRISPASFRAAPSGPSATSARGKTRPKHRRRTGATVSFTLNEPALVTFHVERGLRGHRNRSGHCVRLTRASRHTKRCRRLIVLGSFTEHEGAHADRLHFTGRLNGRALPPGSYTLTATPSAAGVAGRTQTISFRILA
jgi:hypothetical protein